MLCFPSVIHLQVGYRKRNWNLQLKKIFSNSISKRAYLTLLVFIKVYVFYLFKQKIQAFKSVLVSEVLSEIMVHCVISAWCGPTSNNQLYGSL